MSDAQPKTKDSDNALSGGALVLMRWWAGARRVSHAALQPDRDLALVFWRTRGQRIALVAFLLGGWAPLGGGHLPAHRAGLVLEALGLPCMVGRIGMSLPRWSGWPSRAKGVIIAGGQPTCATGREPDKIVL